MKYYLAREKVWRAKAEQTPRNYAAPSHLCSWGVWGEKSNILTKNEADTDSSNLILKNC